MAAADNHIVTATVSHSTAWKSETTGERNPAIDAVRLPEDVFVPRPSYWRIFGDGARRIGRSGRIVGPLALAVTAGGGCDYWQGAVLGITLAIFAGFLTFLGVRRPVPHGADRDTLRIQLPSPVEMFVDGLSPKLWRRHLAHLVKRVQTKSLYRHNNTIRLRTGRPFPLGNIKESARVFDLREEEAMRLAYGAHLSVWNEKRTSNDAEAVIATLEYLADSFVDRRIPAVDEIALVGFSEGFSDLLSRYVRYSARIGELADVFEPAIIHRYFAASGKTLPEGIANAIRIGDTASLDRYHIEWLLDGELRPTGNKEISVVNAFIHACFARRMLGVYDRAVFGETPNYAGRYIETCISHLNSALHIFDGEESTGRSVDLLGAGIGIFERRCGGLMKQAMRLWDQGCIAPMNTEPTPWADNAGAEAQQDLMWHSGQAPMTLRALSIR